MIWFKEHMLLSLFLSYFTTFYFMMAFVACEYYMDKKRSYANVWRDEAKSWAMFIISWVVTVITGTLAGLSMTVTGTLTLFYIFV